MDDDLLIKLVQQNELLYNKYNKDHKSIEKKKAAWQRIAQEMEVSEADCVRRWSSLRDRYTKETRRMAALANNGMTTQRFWPLFNELEFLKPYIVARSNRVNGSSSYSIRVNEDPTKLTTQLYVNENDDTQCDYLAEAFPLKDSTALLTDAEEEAVHEDSNALMQSDSMSSTQFEMNNSSKEDQPKSFYRTISNSTPNQQRNRRKRHYESDAESELANALESFKKICDTTRSRHRNPAVHGFGQMIVETLCSMSERKQAIAMQKVTEIVMTLKMEEE